MTDVRTLRADWTADGSDQRNQAVCLPPVPAPSLGRDDLDARLTHRWSRRRRLRRRPLFGRCASNITHALLVVHSKVQADGGNDDHWREVHEDEVGVVGGHLQDRTDDERAEP